VSSREFGWPVLLSLWWDKFIAVVDSLQTAQYIKQKLLFGISQWQHQGKDSAWPADIPPYTNTVRHLTHIAYFKQEQLGWEQAATLRPWQQKMGQDARSILQGSTTHSAPHRQYLDVTDHPRPVGILQGNLDGTQ